MRRNTLRLAIALVATSFLAACADLSTGPAPRGPRLDEGYSNGSSADSTQTSRTNTQGSTT